MANGKNTIVVYRDWIDIFDDLEDDEAGRLIKHFFRYINDKNPDAPDRLTSLLFKPIKSTLKRDLKKWEAKSLKNSENAKMRWHKEDANACERTNRNAKHADSDSVSDSDSDSVSDKKSKPKRFTPPSLQLVSEYCKERKNNVDAYKFINFYEAKGWMVGSNKMKDWKAAVRTWEGREEKTEVKRSKVRKPNEW